MLSMFKVIYKLFTIFLYYAALWLTQCCPCSKSFLSYAKFFPTMQHGGYIYVVQVLSNLCDVQPLVVAQCDQ